MTIHPNVIPNETAVLKMDDFEKGAIVFAINDCDTGWIIQRQNISLLSGLNQTPLKQTASLKTYTMYTLTLIMPS